MEPGTNAFRATGKILTRLWLRWHACLLLTIHEQRYLSCYNIGWSTATAQHHHAWLIYEAWIRKLEIDLPNRLRRLLCVSHRLKLAVEWPSQVAYVVLAGRNHEYDTIFIPHDPRRRSSSESRRAAVVTTERADSMLRDHRQE